VWETPESILPYRTTTKPLIHFWPSTALRPKKLKLDCP